MRKQRRRSAPLLLLLWIVQPLYYLNRKYQASSHLMWLYSPVCVGPGRKPRRPVFSQRGSFVLISGVFHCKVVNGCPILVISSSIYTLVSVSFERRQVMQGQGQGKLITRKKQIAIIFFTWVFSIGIASPTLLEYSLYTREILVGNQTQIITSCGSNISRELALGNVIFVFVISYFIPVILMTRNYSQVAIYVWKKGKWIKRHLVPSGLNSASARIFKYRTRIVKLLVVVAAIFAVSWFPFFVILIYAVSIEKKITVSK